MVVFDDSMVILEKLKTMLRKILKYVYMNAVLNVYLMNTDLLN